MSDHSSCMLNRIAPLVLLACLLCFGVGCKTLFQLPLDAETAYETKQYAVASKLLIDKYNATDKVSEQADIAYKIGESYRLSNQPSKAEQWYKKALEYSTDTQVTLRYAQMLQGNGKYEEAMSFFKEYSLSNPSDRLRANKAIQACKQAKLWLKEPTTHEVQNLGALNSNASDFAPVFLEEDEMVFTSSRAEAMGDKEYGWTGEKHSDLFFTKQSAAGNWGTVEAFADSINTVYNEGTASFTADGKTVYFTACGSDNDADDYCQIYYAQRNEEGAWLLPERLSLFDDIEEEVNTGQPYITRDGKQLYFSADAPGGLGDKDLYRITMGRDGFWGMPENLGPEINTDAYEGFPYIAPDGRLYFASNGHPGMGGLDIFAAELDKKQWRNPVNLQYPINSSADDLSIIFQPVAPEMIDSIEAQGYFSSSRPGGKGSDDIYSFVELIPQPEPEPIDTPVIADVPEKDPTPPPPKPVVYELRAVVKQKVLSNPDDLNSNLVVGGGLPQAIAQVLGLSLSSSLNKRIVADDSGNFTAILEPNTDYSITATKNGYFSQTVQVSTKGKGGQPGQTVVVNAELILEKIYERREIVLDNIYFDLDESYIREDAQPTLNTLATILFENPTIRIEMGSHTDSRGSDSYNSRLSQERAQSTVTYLISKGIPQSRLVARGYGETQLTNECDDGVSCSEEQHQQNRRTSFKVIGQ